MKKFENLISYLLYTFILITTIFIILILKFDYFDFTNNNNINKQEINSVSDTISVEENVNNDVELSKKTDEAQDSLLLEKNLGEKIVDIDGNEYETINIGSQLWMRSNLKVTKYNDGTPLINGNLNYKNEESLFGIYVNYENNKDYGNIYGKLYNWYAAAGIFDEISSKDPTNRKNLAPEGWHVATRDDWNKLNEYLSHLYYDEFDRLLTGEVGAKLREKDTLYWKQTCYGSNSFFNALPGGAKFYDGSYRDMRHVAYWWSLTDEYRNQCNYRAILNDKFIESSKEKNYFFSVRCVKD